MFIDRHDCALSFSDYSGLPKLAPNASWVKVLGRRLRQLVMMNPKHTRCGDIFRNQSAIRAETRRHVRGPHFFVIHPLSFLSLTLETLFFLVWITSFITEPLIKLSLDAELMISWIWVEKNVTSHARLVLILLFFNVGYVENKTKNIILEPKKIIRRYLTTYFFFDIMTTTYVIDLVLPLVSKETRFKVTVPLSGIRMISNIVRIPTLLGFLDNTLANLKFGKMLRTAICLTIKTFLYLNALTFMMYSISLMMYSRQLSAHTQSESWLTKSNMFISKDKSSEETFRKYCEAFLLVSAYFFGVSYKYTMILSNEQVSAVIIAFFGRLYTLYLLADILMMFGIAGISESVFERYLALLKYYMCNQNLPSDLRHRMVTFCKFKFQGRYFKENRIVNTLSDNLRTELYRFAARRLIGKNEIFRRLPPLVLTSLLGDMTAETYSPRDIIIRFGSETNQIYFISTGTVAVMSVEGLELCHLEDGDVFGIGCLISRHQIHRIVAAEMTEVFVISKRKLLSYLSPYPEIMNSFYRSGREWLIKMKRKEEHLSCKKVDLLSILQKGDILEKRTRRVEIHS